jgi:hypothetical protein
LLQRQHPSETTLLTNDHDPDVMSVMRYEHFTRLEAYDTHSGGRKKVHHSSHVFPAFALFIQLLPWFNSAATYSSSARLVRFFFGTFMT